jgi:hypothetical protein
MNQSPRFSSTQFRPALQFFAPGEILAPEQTLSFLRRKVARKCAAVTNKPTWGEIVRLNPLGIKAGW